MRTSGRRVALVLLRALPCAAALVTGTAAAQTMLVQPSAAQRCLTDGSGPVRATPVYPQLRYERREGGRVLAELTFDDADKAPSLRIVEHEGGDEFARSVREYVGAYRVPCLEPGQTATLRQEFVFKPTDGRRVSYMVAADADSQRRARLQGCMVKPARQPHYPLRAQEASEHGKVLLQLAFHDANSAPRVTVLDSVGTRIASAAEQHAAGWRMPCHEGPPVDAVVIYDYAFEGDARTVLQDMSLVTFLRHVKDIGQANVGFDFHAMGCPFEVRLMLFRPFAANHVGEVGDANPERRFFIDWLRQLEVKLDRRTRNALIGESTTISVPCAVLSLGQTDGGGASK